MFVKKPVKGMRDILPNDLLLRERVMNTIEETYRLFGFSRIETPCVEDIGLLTGKNGGDNEKLIFKILKRGRKLEESEDDICDYGLRYDLTVPLTRYYSNNAANLPSVFKAMQIGNVWRADNPQKGRYRQFVQCDIDIIGEESRLAEIELISATSTALNRLGFSDFTVRINDRRILKALAVFCGFEEEDYDKVYISLDKLDKIGMEGVKSELIGEGLESECINKMQETLDSILNAADQLSEACKLLGGYTQEGAFDSLGEIIASAKALTSDCNIEFDITLVRGMNYYTGTIFEIAMNGVGYSVAGGGRYDKLIGRFTGKDAPACGFSIGFERIVAILAERETDKNEQAAVAYILPKDCDSELTVKTFEFAKEKRESGVRCSVFKKMKNFRLQLDELLKDGFTVAYVADSKGEFKEMMLSEKK